MKRIAVSIVAFLFLYLPSPALAKGKTVKITIEGAGLRAPIEIMEPHTLAHFFVRAGPNAARGTSSSDCPPSFVVDWPQAPSAFVSEGISVVCYFSVAG